MSGQSTHAALFYRSLSTRFAIVTSDLRNFPEYERKERFYFVCFWLEDYHFMNDLNDNGEER